MYYDYEAFEDPRVLIQELMQEIEEKENKEKEKSELDISLNHSK